MARVIPEDRCPYAGEFIGKRASAHVQIGQCSLERGHEGPHWWAGMEA